MGQTIPDHRLTGELVFSCTINWSQLLGDLNNCSWRIRELSSVSMRAQNAGAVGVFLTCQEISGLDALPSEICVHLPWSPISMIMYWQNYIQGVINNVGCC